ncbi:MAG: aminopeptidase P N-terminal domain-containing protein, partial [Sandaracinaceae bacterium]|nr:aminopeptidase P N-terminal domain-containing protein [Sandaracinaceae bacterium]
MPTEIFANRRARALREMGERAVLVVPSAPTAIRNNDVEHDYRQDSDFFYLTGLDEPGSVLVLSTAHPEHRFVLFVRPRDPERETWDGPRTGVDGAKERFGADASFEIKELGAKLPDYLQDAERLYYLFGRDRAFDDQVFTALEATRRKARLRKGVPQTTIEPGVLLHEHRLRKDAGELEIMRRASRITGEAHHAAMMLARPGRHEHEVEAELLRVFRRSGAERPAYGPIVGSGPNATILHHRKNDRHMQEGDLLLIDAGVELEYYASDVTRTFPISGRFSAPQRAIYDTVLRAQHACIEAVAPGATVDAIHQIALRVLTEGLIALGLVEGPLDDAVAKERYKPFYMHRTSHWLGMDVHDVGLYYLRGEGRAFEPGMVLTVEPGLYVSTSAEVDPKWRGIGVRIEDDVLVTEGGHENLTAHIPKDPDELERI